MLLALSVFTGCQVESDDEPEKNTFTVTFNANGGSGEMKALTAEEGTEITLTANAFTRDGYTFSGWATSASGNIVHTDGAKIKPTANITLYAQWTEIGKVEKVTFSATGEIDYNERITLSCGTDGATIYYAVVAGTDAPTTEEFSSSKQKYSEPLAITENAVIAAVAVKDGLRDSEIATATFTVKTYTVTFETEHGTAPAKIGDLKKGDKLGDSLPELTAEGYRFDGWFNGESQFTAETEITSNLTLTAKWTKTYTVIFDANGGSCSIASITEVAGAEITLPANTFTKDGYIFAGWATSADGSVSYSDKAKITVTENITLYAKWGMTAAAAITEISSFADGEEHTVAVAGAITADDLAAIKGAINGNSNHPQIILDLGGTTGLTEIPSEAFKECRYLTGVNIPSSVTSIGRYAFSDSPLTNITIPDSVTSIGDYAFSRCARLKSVAIPESVTSIGNNVFDYCDFLTSVTIPDTVTSIGNSAFANCYSLTDVNIPSSVTSIGRSAFTYCESLTSVNIPDSVTSIGNGAFAGCSSLTSVNIPSSVASLGESAFSSCSGLTSVTIPKSIASIGFGTFYKCGNLTTVNYKGSKEDWDKITIESTYNDNLLNAALICLGSEQKEVYTPADKAAAAIATLEGGTRENLNVYTVKITDKALTAEQLKEIGTAIRTKTNGTEWNGLISLDLSSATGLTEISEKTFYRCWLEELILPDSLETIGIGALENNHFEEIVIPDNVKTIEKGVFSGCSRLKTITFPASLTSIGASAFVNTALKTVNYKGTQAQWETLKANISTTGNDKLTGAKIICTDGVINGE